MRTISIVHAAPYELGVRDRRVGCGRLPARALEAYPYDNFKLAYVTTIMVRGAFFLIFMIVAALRVTAEQSQ